MNSTDPRPSVLVLGATGYLGRAVTRRLTQSGADVTAWARSPETAAQLPPEVAIVTGDATDTETLGRAITAETTAVVNLLAPGDAEVDLRVTRAVLEQLGTRPGRTYLYISGVWVLGPTPSGTAADETTPTSPLALVQHRPLVEQAVLEGHLRGVRGIVVRPGVVHDGGQGIPGLLADLAAQHGHGVRVGEHTVHWPMVHREDVADLVELALRAGPAEGGLYHAVAEPAVDTADLAAAAAASAGVAIEVRSWPLAEAAQALGAGFADALACDQTVAATAAQALGWQPSRPGAVADLRATRRAAAAR